MTLSAPIAGLIVKKTGRYKWATVGFCTGPVIAMVLLARLTPESHPITQWLSTSFNIRISLLTLMGRVQR